jgi:alpha-beta hydrolase superfamily lysophospholipase
MADIIAHASISLAVFALLLITALCLIASPFPRSAEAKNIFGFTARPSYDGVDGIPDLRRYAARDGEALAFRLYESTSDRILIFVHGSSSHGAGYHKLASFLSGEGSAKVVLPNLRGHYLSGKRRGDVDYMGQLEDDLADLVRFLRTEGLEGPITLGGHSSGGGLAIRFAGGPRVGDVSSFLLLSPIVPVSPAVRGGNSGGWANLHRRRLYGLIFLNAFYIHGFDALPIIEFNKPVQFWDGMETLSYSWRLNASYHPRYKYKKDIHALAGHTLVLVGANDQSVDPEALRGMFSDDRVKILPGIDHFGVFREEAALETMADWLQSLPQWTVTAPDKTS